MIFLSSALTCTVHCIHARISSRFQSHADLYFSFLLGLYGIFFAIKPVLLQLWAYAVLEVLENILLAVMSPGTTILSEMLSYAGCLRNS